MADLSIVEEEYIAEFTAKGAVMGLNYSYRGHYFYDANTDVDMRQRYCADTMDEIDMSEAGQRSSRFVTPRGYNG